MTDGGFSGPSVQVNSQERHHVIVVEAPSPGWEATLTRVLPGPGHREAYLTLRRPFPGALYPQVIVTQRVLTGVPTKEALRVYARIVDHDAPARSDEPFAQAAEARGATP
ncbi:MAG: hypothetical protein SFY69_05295 [Planctomycetota bacterium]|nr:hypothetical protein [Planctomycetota bacterium]